MQRTKKRKKILDGARCCRQGERPRRGSRNRRRCASPGSPPPPRLPRRLAAAAAPLPASVPRLSAALLLEGWSPTPRRTSMPPACRAARRTEALPVGI